LEEVVCTQGIEAFNLLFNFFTLNEPKAVMVCLDPFKLQIMTALFKSFYRGSRCFMGRFFQKGVGDPNLFTVSQTPFFRSLISKVCQKNKVSEGISKKSPVKHLAVGGINLL
jgi:hypothetical protein